ncbi:MAG: hypothetical protein ACLF0G_11520 [Candidatus Brocadiia bacterium]
MDRAVIPRPPAARRGSVLLLVLFLMAITAPLVALMLEAHGAHLRCVHNDLSGHTALYVAEAGVQRAVAELLADPAWRTGFTDVEFPEGSGHTYTVAVADTSEGELCITSTAHTADGYAKTVSVVVSGF